MRLIDAEEFEARLRMQPNELSRQTVIDMVHATPTKKGNEKWILTCEKKPEKEGFYLVTKAYYDCNYKALNGRVLVDRIWIQPGCFDETTIVAWMEDPAPFPYKR